jgi:hypothetical protein
MADVRSAGAYPLPLLTITMSGWKPTPVIFRLSEPSPVYEPVASHVPDVGVFVAVGMGVGVLVGGGTGVFVGVGVLVLVGTVDGVGVGVALGGAAGRSSSAR